MGMSTHVVGFKPPDDKWKKMKAVYDACRAASVRPPKDVEDFFCDCPPDNRGVEVTIERTACASEYNDSGRQGFEIDIKKLPADVTIIRFYNSY
jgi:hypothetical protein